MLTFSKAQLASLLATAVDFGLTAWLGSYLQPPYVAASVLGTCGGGMLHFWLGRHWVFRGRGSKIAWQAARYGAVWTGNLLLNGAGVLVAAHWAGLHHLVGKAIVSLLLATTYNYLLQSHFVFQKS
jgi:putative flippase GtrA